MWRTLGSPKLTLMEAQVGERLSQLQLMRGLLRAQKDLDQPKDIRQVISEQVKLNLGLHRVSWGTGWGRGLSIDAWPGNTSRGNLPAAQGLP